MYLETASQPTVQWCPELEKVAYAIKSALTYRQKLKVNTYKKCDNSQ